MYLIDTHTHLFHKQFDNDRREMMDRCFREGVERVLLPNIDVSTIAAMMDMVSQYPGRAFPMMGIHPSHIGEDRHAQLAEVRRLVEENPKQYVAIGEIGIDLYWEKDKLDWQIEAFADQIDLALTFGLPVVIHCREAFEPVFSVLESKQTGTLKGVLHCFTGTPDQAKRCIELGMHLGIGGVATFKNGGLDQVLPHVPVDKLLLETDSPYLAPVPHRGKRNESSYLPLIAQRVAELTGMTPREVANTTTRNAEKLFNLPA